MPDQPSVYELLMSALPFVLVAASIVALFFVLRWLARRKRS